MRIAKTTKRFRKDYTRLKKSGRRNMEKLNMVLDKLVEGKILGTHHKDHPLQGEYRNYRDCHIEGDWVLLYELNFDEEGNETVTFCATDNHSNLFG